MAGRGEVTDAHPRIHPGLAWLAEVRPAMLQARREQPETLQAVAGAFQVCPGCGARSAVRTESYPADLAPDGPSLGLILSHLFAAGAPDKPACGHLGAQIVGAAAVFQESAWLDRRLVCKGLPPAAEVEGIVHNPDSGAEQAWPDLESAWLNQPAEPPTAAQCAYGLLLDAQKAYAERRLDDALELLGEAVKLRANFRLAYFNAAAILREQARFAEACAHLMEAKRLHPLNKETRVLLMETLFFAGQYEVAAHEAHDALRVDKQDATYQLLAGKAFGKCGLMERSVVHLQNAASLDPALWEAHFLQGMAWEHMNDPQRSVEHFKAALRHGCDADAAQVCRTRIREHGGFLTKWLWGKP